MYKFIAVIFYFILTAQHGHAQLKYLLEDFEGLSDGSADLKENGIFSFGNLKINVDGGVHGNFSDNRHHYAGKRALKITRQGKTEYGGWGKGIGMNVELDVNTDFLNFYFYRPQKSGAFKIRLELQEDDNSDNIYRKENDDAWEYTLVIDEKDLKEKWTLISIPLNEFKDSNKGGDGVFNTGYKNGRIFTLLMDCYASRQMKEKESLFFDFICFSKGKLPTGSGLFDAPEQENKGLCSLGAWSGEGNVANFAEIASTFENNFLPGCEKKLGVVHFFQPFGKNIESEEFLYPSVERINKVIHAGYIPMITLEDHFIQIKPGEKPPNLYSIIEGHYDSFFGCWANQIKQVEGTVLLRILHEFNGDWYPWCTVNNDKNPHVVAKAYRYIRNIFTQNNVNNVRFIWCPNSMSMPMEPWNYIMDAYPGDEYVDFVGLDIYNGAGKSSTWRSFRKEGIENYFILTEQLPDKPLIICETASRERSARECASCQKKPEWIKDMSEALKTDMSKIRLLSWFNEKETFKINSSSEAKAAYLNYVMKDDYYHDGPNGIKTLIGP